MNILVVSYSTIVIELLKLVFKENSIKNEHIKSVNNAKSDSFSVIFIDDSTINLKEQLEDIINNFSYSKLVFIGNADKNIENMVDIVVKKPFLPKDIKEIIDDIDFNKENVRTSVLDAQEIAKIKELMNLDDEILNNNNIFDNLRDKKDIILKRKEAKDFLLDCTKQSKKELKKMLKGAKISVKIKFKRDSYE